MLLILHYVCISITFKSVKTVNYHKIKLAKNSKMFLCHLRISIQKYLSRDSRYRERIAKIQEKPRGYKGNRIDISLLKGLNVFYILYFYSFILILYILYSYSSRAK